MNEQCYDIKHIAYSYLQNYSKTGNEIFRIDVINFLRAKLKCGASNINSSIIGSVNIVLKALCDNGFITRVSRGKYVFMSKLEMSFVEFYNTYIYGRRF
jgi:hypothetical protein